MIPSIINSVIDSAANILARQTIDDQNNQDSQPNGAPKLDENNPSAGDSRGDGNRGRDVGTEEEPIPTFPHSRRHYPDESTLKSLESLGLELSQSGSQSKDCEACDDPCSAPIDMEGYPSTFSIDLTSPILGTVKPFDYLVLCSSGKSDWPHDVCSDLESVPGALRQAYPKGMPGKRGGRGGGRGGRGGGRGGGKEGFNRGPPIDPSGRLPGMFDLPAHVDPEKAVGATDQGEEERMPIKMSILSSSHISRSTTAEGHSLMVLPDWIILEDVKSSQLPKFPLNLDSKLKLPYRAIVLICSHKTRDKRCSISAPILEENLMDSLERSELDWKIDRRGDLDHEDCDLIEENWIGIFRVSHSGGHKFAGNVIINFPSGVSIWYGRVTPKDCKRIVEETIEKKKILPELLKGGIGITGKNLKRSDW